MLMPRLTSNASTANPVTLAGLLPVLERTWVAQHEHDDEVSSVAIEADGDVNANKLNAWLAKLLREKGVDIFRMKGFISIAGESQRFVFQGVHMLFDGQPERPWGNDPRHNQLVFIGRQMDEAVMRARLDKCLLDEHLASADSEAWASLPNPFPELQAAEESA